MSKPTLAIDADDTLFDENDAIRRFFNDNYGANHTIEDYLVDGEYYTYWEPIWNKSPEETNDIYDKFVVSTYKQNLLPIKDAVEVLTMLKEQYELVIVTSRDHRTVDVTHKEVQKYFPNMFNDIHFVPLWGGSEKATKAKICNEIGASYLIDDNFDHCKLAADSGIQTILFGDYGWNRIQTLSEGITRCYDWKEVLEFLR